MRNSAWGDSTCWAYDFVDPWGNHYELNCYDYDQVRADLVEADAITPTRYWSQDRYLDYRRGRRGSDGTS